MKKLGILSILVIALLTSSCQYITGEALEPAAAPIPAAEPELPSKSEALPAPESELPFEAGISAKECNLPGEDVLYGIGITNLSSGIITIDPFPPAMWIKPVGQDEAVYSRAAGNRTLDIGNDYPDSWYHTKGSWDQKDNNGQQVAPGWYEISYEYVIIEKNTGKRYTANPTARFQIVHPESAMNKDLEVNQSVMVEGITVILERIELNPVEVTVYTFTTPPGYSLPEEHPPHELESLMINSTAEYSVDGGTIKHVRSGGGKADSAGITLTWDEIDPIPVDARELTFTITQLGDWKGHWEFEVSLDGDSNASQNVTVSQLVSQADRYNGKVVTLDAFYFYAVMESNALVDSVGLEFSDDTKVIPVGAQIRVKGNISQELQNQLYTQESPSPTNTEYFGKLRITGKFEIDDIDGEYQIDVTKAEVLEWTSPPIGTTTPTGNLQIKIENAFLGGLLQGVEVISSKQPDGQPELSGLTDDNGMVTFDDIKQGRYEFIVNLEGYLQMNIRLAVTGGRTTSVAFLMARIGEAPDDILPAPGLGPQYRANILAQGVVNPWPPIESTKVTLGASSDAVQVTYRDYIESEAGQTRNNIFYMYRPNSSPNDTSLDVILKAIDPPSCITVTQEGGWSGPGTQTKAFLKIEISQEVKPGEYAFGIHVLINGEDYGTIPCTVKVIEDTQSTVQVPPADEEMFLKPTAKIRVGHSAIGRGQAYFRGTTEFYNGTLRTQLYRDEKPLDWWPADQDIKANGYIWEITVSMPEELPVESYYILKIWVKDNPSLYGVHGFDEKGPPSASELQ